MNLSAQLEAVLFVEAKPVGLTRLAQLLNCSAEQITTAVTELQKQYATEQRGLRLVITNSKVQFVTAPECHELIAKVINDERTGELSRPALETLAIIAYRSPVTKAELEMIRGINCSLIIRNLLIRGLIEEQFDKTKGVEVYDITTQYLQLLGVSAVQQLPNYEHLHRDIKIGEVLAQNQPSQDFFQALQNNTDNNSNNTNDQAKTE
jgi:segregation and condensation protein B